MILLKFIDRTNFISFFATFGKYKSRMFFVFIVTYHCTVIGQTPLKKTLQQLQHRYSFYFSYDVKYASQPVGEIQDKPISIEEQLYNIFKNSPLSYQKIASNIYVIRTTKAVSSPLKRFIVHRQNRLLDTLITSENLLDEVQISSINADSLTYHLLIDQIPLSKANLLPSVFGKDVFSSLQYTAGVSSVVEPATGLYVRGGTPDQSLMLLDGIFIFNADHPLATHSYINAGALSQVDFQKSYVSPRLGGRVSSFVEMSTKSYGQVKDQAEINLRLWGTELYLEQRLSKRVSLLFSFRNQLSSNQLNQLGTRLIDQRNLIQNNLGEGKYNSKSKYYDLISSIEYQTSQNSRLKATVYFANDQYQKNYDTNTNLKTLLAFVDDPNILVISDTNGVANPLSLSNRWQNSGYSLQYTHAWNSRSLTKINISGSQNHQKFITNLGDSEPFFQGALDNSMLVNPIINSLASQENNSTLYSMSLDNFSTKANIEWNWGGQVIVYNNKYINEITQITSVREPYLSDYSNKYTSFAAYIEAGIPLSQWGKLKVGLRASEWGNAQELLGEPRIEIEEKKGNWRTQLYFTRQRQAFKKLSYTAVPTIFNGVWYLADGFFMPITTVDMIGSSVQYNKNRLTTSIQFYHKQMKNLSELGAKYQVQPIVALDNGDGKSTGLELSLMKEIKKGLLRFDYTFNHTQYRFKHLSKNTYFKAPYLPKHEIKAVGIYRYKGLDMAATWIVGLNRPYAISRIIDISQNENDFFDPNDYNKQSLTPYHRLDIAVTYHFKNHWQFGITVQNLYNRANEWYKIALTPGPNAQITTINQPGMLPNLKVSYRF